MFKYLSDPIMSGGWNATSSEWTSGPTILSTVTFWPFCLLNYGTGILTYKFRILWLAYLIDIIEAIRVEVAV